jgi:hypothetical protein
MAAGICELAASAIVQHSLMLTAETLELIFGDLRGIYATSFLIF